MPFMLGILESIIKPAARLVGKQELVFIQRGAWQQLYPAVTSPKQRKGSAPAVGPVIKLVL